jgi:hypothetical protein
MKIKLIVIASTFLFFACAKEERNTSITGNIQGLKKGVLYLEKVEDTLMTTIDSLVMSGQGDFIFSLQLESPEVLYLFLRKTDGIDIEDGIEFFAEPGNIEINTTLNNFEGNAHISGSINHDKFIEYQKLMQRYTDRGLELFVENFEAEKDNDEPRKIKVNQQYESLIKSRYMATINFAINHNEYEVAPYLALSEIYDANVKYLDTIYHSLTPNVKESVYGKQLESYIKERKTLKINE